MHADDGSPNASPYTPAAQSTQVLHPDSEYRPTGHSMQLLVLPAPQVPAAHGVPVVFVDPAGHALPPGAVQLPEHAGLNSPVLLPKVPGGHSPLHAGLNSPVLLPKVPGGHSVQPPTAPPTLYDPGGHCRQPVVKVGPRYCPGAHTSISQTCEAASLGYPTGVMSFKSKLFMCALFSVPPRALFGSPNCHSPQPTAPQFRLEALVPSTQLHPAVATAPVRKPPTQAKYPTLPNRLLGSADAFLIYTTHQQQTKRMDMSSHDPCDPPLLQ